MRWKSDLILLFVAALWGTGFLAQRLATTQLSPFYFNGGRFLIAALVILGLMRLRGGQPEGQNRPITRRQLVWMLVAGIFLFGAAWFQQAGLATTSIGNASFITGLYVVLVPVILFLFLRERIAWLSWAAVVIAGAGAALLSLQGELRMAPGDVLELIGAVMWALHVITVGRLARQGVNVLAFSVIQFSMAAALNLLVALGLDPQGAQGLLTGWPAVLYSALFPIGLGFTLQIAGQKHAPAVDAAIILSMEAVFGTLFAFLFFQELLTLRQLAGCALIFVAIIVAQIRVGEPLPAEPAR